MFHLYLFGALAFFAFFLLLLIRQRKKREAKQRQWEISHWRWRVGKAKARRFFYFLVLVLVTGVVGIIASIHSMLMPAIVVGAALYFLWRLFQRVRRWWARTWAKIVHVYWVVRKLWEQVPEKIRRLFLIVAGGILVYRVVYEITLWGLMRMF